MPDSSLEGGAWTHGYTFHGDAEKIFRDFFGGVNPFQGISDEHVFAFTSEINRNPTIKYVCRVL